MLAWKLILKKDRVIFYLKKPPKKQNNGHLPQTKTVVNKKNNQLIELMNE